MRKFFDHLMNAGQVAEFKELVARCRAFVLTVGVAPVWFSKETHEIVLQPDKRVMGQYEMRTLSPTWNAGNIRRVLAAIRAVNASARIFLTLSPTPLNYSFEFPSTIVADCLSKSTLRVAIHEVLAENPEGVRYWPSFEVVRWVGAHLGTVYGADDGNPRHVSDYIVDAIVRSFILMHGGVDREDQVDLATSFENSAPFALARNF